MDSRDDFLQKQCQNVGPFTQILCCHCVEMTDMARQMKNRRWRHIAQICRNAVILVKTIRAYVGTPELAWFSPLLITVSLLSLANGQVEGIIHAGSAVTWTVFCKDIFLATNNQNLCKQNEPDQTRQKAFGNYPKAQM